ncbi:MAG: triose-phosphate isomerase [Candidatus Kapaibacteriota bacterium]|jgi:triosephosphate isomerase
MKQMLIAGNWKMHKTLKDAVNLASRIVDWASQTKPRSQVAICPPFPFLESISRLLNGSMVGLGAQNCHYENEGAYTGEVSPPMLKSVGCDFVIIGHSERRTYFQENDELINKKILSALNFDLRPIFCIGETLSEREKNLTFEVIERQIRKGLEKVTTWQAEKIFVAYEPVWAIGTGISAKTEQIDDAHRFIRNLLVEMFNERGQKIAILYGGSLNSKNAREIFSLPEVNGGLIGKSSLDSEEFTKIVDFAEESI